MNKPQFEIEAIYAEQAEKAVIGALLIDVRAYYELTNHIKSADVFYKEDHRAIFEACKSIKAAGGEIDIITVSHEIRRAKKEGLFDGLDYSLAMLSQAVSSTAHLEHHALIVLQAYLKRSLMSYAQKIFSEAQDVSADPIESLTKAREILTQLDAALMQQSVRTWQDILTDMAKQVAALTDNPEAFLGIRTGFNKLDGAVGGWQPGQLIILAARPGMGKSAFVVKLAHEAAMQAKRVAFFSLEMTDVQISKRFVSNISNIHSQMLYTHGLQKPGYIDTFINTVEQLRTLPIELIEAPGIDVNALAYKCMQIKDAKGLDLVIVDYLQIMESAPGSDKMNREQQISYMSRTLKRLALQLNVPVIALSQLSREVDKRASKRPVLSDLRESGAIEQDADIVLFLYRESYYVERGLLPADNVNEEVAEVIIGKNRNGQVAGLDIGWDAERTRFYDIEPDRVKVPY